MSMKRQLLSETPCQPTSSRSLFPPTRAANRVDGGGRNDNAAFYDALIIGAEIQDVEAVGERE